MGKAGVKTGGEHSPFVNIKTYSVSDILAAGGTTAFADKLRKDTQLTIDRLKELPKENFLTDEEADAALEFLKNNK